MSTLPAVLQPESAAPPKKGIEVTEKALKRIRSAMAKEGISPAERMRLMPRAVCASASTAAAAPV
jgi:hypothetical protein